MNISNSILNNKNEIRRFKKFEKQDSLTKSPSFKSNPAATLIAKADEPIMDIFAQHYGNVGKRLGFKLGKLATESKILKKGSRFNLETGISSIKSKGPIRAFFEKIIFPVVTLPLYGASFVLKKVQNIPKAKDSARKIYNKPLIRIPRKLNEIDSKTDMIKGIYDKTEELINKFAKSKNIEPKKLVDMLNNPKNYSGSQATIKEANEYLKENLYKVSNKFFDKYTGNFNTALERPLNRIVSGLIPVLFLANDAYNLSVLCGDAKKEATKEAKERRNQEIARVMLTAYIQLITFGVFTKKVNTSSWFAPAISALTVLTTEIISRLAVKKPIFFLSKERAKKYNNKKGQNVHLTQNKELNKTLQNKVKEESLNTKSEIKITLTDNDKKDISLKNEKPSVFKEMEIAFGAKEIQSNINNKNEKLEKKTLININTLKKAVGILIAAGFVLSFFKNSSLTKNSKVKKGLNKVGKFFKNKIYDPLAFKEFKMSEENFTNITDSLKDVSFDKVADGHAFIKSKYSQQTKDGIFKIYKHSLPVDKADEAISAVVNKLKAKTSVADSDISKITTSIKAAIDTESVALAEHDYKTIAQKAAKIIKNKNIRLNETQLSDLTNSIAQEIGTRTVATPIKVETKLKPFVDVVTEPFKFIMSALRLPFKLTTGVVNLAVSPVEKKAAKALLGEAELNKFEKAIHKAVTEIYGTKSPKAKKISQTIFVNAMENLNKETAGYQKALKSLKDAQKVGIGVEKATAKLQKETEKLKKYVGTAIEKSFDCVSQSSNKNTDLAMMVKVISSTITSAFLVADNYNMVMLKSDGEDKDGAKEKANERIVQRLSAMFYQTLLINWFNSTFRSQYNKSLLGMSTVTGPCTLTGEILTRASIGMPIRRKTYEEIQQQEEKNENRKGFLGKYFKFMRLLTGKKPLKDRLPKDKQLVETKVAIAPEQINVTSKNIFEQYFNV